MPGLLKTLQKIPSVHVRHGQIENDDVGIVNVEGAQPLSAITSQEHSEALLPQRGRQHSSQRQVVVDDQHTLAIDVVYALRFSAVLRPYVHQFATPAAETDMRKRDQTVSPQY
ncbi:MAG: hypothetical protein ABI837_08970 [Acidobacteriota bacterium]